MKKADLARGVRLFDEFRHDLRYGTRLLAKNPGVSLIAILTLALGIGANTAIFSVVNAFILRPLPYGDPDRLMTSLLFEVSPTDPATFGAVTLCVIVATIFACYIPARRATKVDPLVALRYE